MDRTHRREPVRAFWLGVGWWSRRTAPSTVHSFWGEKPLYAVWVRLSQSRCALLESHPSQRVPRCQLPFQGSPWLVRCCKCIRAAGLWLMLEATDYGGSRVTTAVRKLQRSGKRFAYRVTGYGCRHKSVWQPGQCAAEVSTSYLGGEIQGRGDRPPPLAASFFPDSFFAAEERIGPPEGASPIAR